MHACIGESVVYTCEVHNGITLQFSSTQFDANPVRFTRDDGIGFSARRGPFQAILIDVNTTSMFTANFSAQLNVRAVIDLNGSLIECSGGGEARSTTLVVSGKNIMLSTISLLYWLQVNNHVEVQDITDLEVPCNLMKPPVG